MNEITLYFDTYPQARIALEALLPCAESVSRAAGMESVTTRDVRVNLRVRTAAMEERS